MSIIPLDEASKRLPDLVEQAARGEEVIITRGDGMAFKLTPVAQETPRPTFGSARGLVAIGDDFDAPISDFDAPVP